MRPPPGGAPSSPGKIARNANHPTAAKAARSPIRNSLRDPSRDAHARQAGTWSVCVTLLDRLVRWTCETLMWVSAGARHTQHFDGNTNVGPLVVPNEATLHLPAREGRATRAHLVNDRSAGGRVNGLTGGAKDEYPGEAAS
jgi:hypothetical protein